MRRLCVSLLAAALLSAGCKFPISDRNEETPGVLWEERTRPLHDAGPEDPPIAYAAPPDPGRVYVQSLQPEGGRALIVGLPGAVAPDVTEVCARVVRTGQETCLASAASPAGASFHGGITAFPGDIVQIWGNGPRYLPGGPGINSIEKKVLYWSARFPYNVTAAALTSRGLFLGTFGSGLFFIRSSDLFLPAESIYPKKYTVADGLPSASVTKLAADPQGALWIGTDRGLARLSVGADGYESIFPYSGSLLPAEYINAVVSRRDEVWIGTSSGLILLKEGSDGTPETVTFTSADSPLPTDRILSLALDPDGSIWAGTDAGICRIFPGRRTIAVNHYPENLAGIRLKAIAPDGRGGAWAGGENRPNGGFNTAGLNHLILENGGSRVVRYPADRGWEIHGLLYDGADGVWVGSDSNLHHAVRSGNGVTFREYYDGVPVNQVSALAADAAGNLFIGTWYQAARLALARGEERIIPYATASGLPDDRVKALAFDGAGDLWIGTENGLAALRLGPDGSAAFTSFRNDRNDPDSLPHDRITTLASDLTGGLWIGSESLAHLTRSADGRVTFRRRSLPVSRTTTYGVGISSEMIADREGVWFGTHYDGLYYFSESDGFRAFRHDPADADSLPSDRIYALAPDAHGNFWIGTEAGLSRMIRPPSGEPRFEAYPLPGRGGGNRPVWTLAIGQDGSLWFPDHETRFENGRLRVSSHLLRLRFPESGAEIDRYGGPADLYIRRLFPRPGGVAIATDAGFFELEMEGSGPRLHQPYASILPSPSVTALLPLPSGGLWIGTSNGLLLTR